MKAGATNVRPFGVIQKMVRSAKAAGKKVVTTNGCFDILHVGHVRYLERAKSLGDLLIVGVNSDSSVRTNKGPSRPIVPERERAEVIASLKSVDAVFIFNDATPVGWLKELKPHIHVKGADRGLGEIIEKKTVEEGGGRIVRAPYVKDRSTTNIVRRILKARD